MTYTQGSTILASDYNGFVGPTASGGTLNANLNDFWATGATDKGWGQTVVANPAIGNTITATQFATLVTNMATAANHTGVAITSRTAPVAGNTIVILAAINTDLTALNTGRGNAVASGTEVGTFSGTTSKTTATGSGGDAWTITFTHTVTFGSANAARFFWNAGGLVRLQFGKSSEGTDHDPDWNTLSGYPGSIFLSGRVNSATQNIAAQAYTGTTRLSGSGGTQTTLATTTGWYNLTGSPTTIFQLNNDASPYTPEFIRVTATATSATVLTLVTTWVEDGTGAPGTTANITGGTATTSPSTTITGDAPTTLCTFRPPSSTYLSAEWGTPTIAASVA